MQGQIALAVGYKDDPQDTPVELKKYLIDCSNVPETSTKMVTELWTIDAGSNHIIKSVITVNGIMYNNTVKLNNIFFTQDHINDMSLSLTNFQNQHGSQARFDEIDTEATRLLSSAQRMASKFVISL